MGSNQMSVPRVTYFGIRGRAEPARLILAYAGVEFEDERLTFEQFGQMKAEGKFQLGQVPTYKDDDVEIPQSMAIVRHLGRKYNLYGSNLSEQARVDVGIETGSDAGLAVFMNLNEKFKGGDRSDFEAAVEKSMCQLEKAIFVLDLNQLLPTLLFSTLLTTFLNH